MTIISLDGVAKAFGTTVAVDDVSLAIEPGEFFALLGPSGCGKTSLLRLLAGFELPDRGCIRIDGVDLTAAPPNRRPVNMVFQNHALFPHMTAAENIAYGLRVEAVPTAERTARVAGALALVRLGDLGHRRPDQLSGGQRQRVALARALVKRPRVLLLDEPLSALDAGLRAAMRAELVALQQAVGITFVMVTHDQDEALALATRCAVMNTGRIEQVATPAELYEAPASRFVAGFIGAVNLFEAVATGRNGPRAVFTTPDLPTPIEAASAAGQGARVWLAIRPERFELHPPGAPGPTVPATIRRVTYLGNQRRYDVELAGGRRVEVSRPNHAGADFATGTAVGLAWGADAAVVLPA